MMEKKKQKPNVVKSKQKYFHSTMKTVLAHVHNGNREAYIRRPTASVEIFRRLVTAFQFQLNKLDWEKKMKWQNIPQQQAF